MVFFDSKFPSKEYENINIFRRKMSDLELNFYNFKSIRKSYFLKLLSTKTWTPNEKPKQHNSIIIFEWDDTLFPTSFLTPGGVFNENMNLSDAEKKILLKIEQASLKLLTEANKKGNVYIITNARNGWVEYSAHRFYPNIIPILENINIISVRQYEKKFPRNSKQWKIEAFLNLQKKFNINLLTNIISIVNFLVEIEAGRILCSKFTEAFIKTIIFTEEYKLDELLKQLKLVFIYSSIKDLTINLKEKSESI